MMVGGVCPACVGRTMKRDFFSVSVQEAELEEKEPLSLNVQGYEIQELVGGGGMGEVYRAVLTARGRVVAMKVVSGRLTRDPEVTARFETEVAALSQLNHANVVRVLDHGETVNGRHFLVMEYVDGCDLRRLLRAQKLDVERALDIFSKVCAGVIHAHQRGFIHRDIKPANILIGADGTVKVADFGLAKTLVETASDYSHTHTRDTFGTPYYVAPEVTRCEGKADVKADIYALGVLLYELLAGVVPMGQFTPLSKKTGLSKKIDAIVASALADDPQHRMGSVKELSEAVEKLAADRRRGREKRIRSRRLMAGALVLGVLGLGAAVGSLIDTDSASAGPRAAKSNVAPAEPTHGWENSLGMKFVPVPGTQVLFSRHETRRRDYEAYAGPERKPVQSLTESVAKIGSAAETPPATWREPGFPQTPDHPVCGISQLDARLFCAWLTNREIASGWLKKGQAYRLPTDAEWSQAAGLTADPGPYVRNPLPLEASVLPTGNFAGPEARRFAQWPDHLATSAPEDAFVGTAPVGSFPANAFGLYDMHGNVAEWMDTRLDWRKLKSPFLYCLRGGSWATGQVQRMMPEVRQYAGPSRAQADFGFRIVLDVDGTDPTPAPLDPLFPDG